MNAVDQKHAADAQVQEKASVISKNNATTLYFNLSHFDLDIYYEYSLHEKAIPRFNIARREYVFI